MSSNEAVERTAALWWLVCKLQEQLLKALDSLLPPPPPFQKFRIFVGYS